jgi:ankyrin repeat protein
MQLLDSPACTSDIINLDSGDDYSTDIDGFTVHPRTVLQTALATPHRTVITKLVGMGADVHATTSEGVTTLHLACIRQLNKTIKQLIKVGQSPLVSALDNSGRGPMWYLFRGCVGAHSLTTSQTFASAYRKLVAAGAVVDESAGNVLEALLLGFQQQNQDYAPTDAVKDACQIAMSLPINLDVITRDGCSLVLLALRTGSKEFLETVLEKVQPSTLNALYKVNDSLWQTPLHFAVRNNRLRQFVPMLVHAGAKLAQNSAGQTPLQLAQELYEYELVKLLEPLVE